MTKDIHIAQDEQLEKVKNWWKDNGTGIVIGVVLGLGLIIGYNWWQSSQDKKALQAATLFSELLAATEAKDLAATNKISETLKVDFAGNDYAAKGLIVAAMAKIKAGEAEAAKADLQWVVDQSELVDNKLLAGFRLARQLYREKQYEQALALLEIEDKAGFASQYFELIGDINQKQGELKAAQDAYKQALELMPAASSGSGYGEILQLKINNTAS